MSHAIVILVYGIILGTLIQSCSTNHITTLAVKLVVQLTKTIIVALVCSGFKLSTRALASVALCTECMMLSHLNLTLYLEKIHGITIITCGLTSLTAEQQSLSVSYRHSHLKIIRRYSK